MKRVYYYIINDTQSHVGTGIPEIFALDVSIVLDDLLLRVEGGLHGLLHALPVGEDVSQGFAEVLRHPVHLLHLLNWVRLVAIHHRVELPEPGPAADQVLDFTDAARYASPIAQLPVGFLTDSELQRIPIQGAQLRNLLVGGSEGEQSNPVREFLRNRTITATSGSASMGA